MWNTKKEYNNRSDHIVAQKREYKGQNIQKLSSFSLQREEMGTQTTSLGFMVEFQDVKGNTKEEPFHGDITFSTG